MFSASERKRKTEIQALNMKGALLSLSQEKKTVLAIRERNEKDLVRH